MKLVYLKAMLNSLKKIDYWDTGARYLELIMGFLSISLEDRQLTGV